MAYTKITNATLMRFQDRLLPLIAAFTSGATLAWMHTDNQQTNKFAKYHHVAIPFLPNYNFYVYAHTDETAIAVTRDIKNISAAIEAKACLNSTGVDKV